MKTRIAFFIVFILLLVITAWMIPLILQSRGVPIEGSTDVLLNISIDAKKLIAEVDQRAAEAKKKDPKWIAFRELTKKYGGSRAEIYLHRAPGKPVLPIIMFLDPGGKIAKGITSDPLFSAYIEKGSDGFLRPKWDAIPQAATVPEEQKQFAFKSIGKYLTGAPEHILKQIEAGTLQPQESFAAKLGDRARGPDSIAVISVLVPEEIHTDWAKQLSEREELKGIGMARMFAGVFISLLEELVEPLKTTRGITVSFNFDGKGWRRLFYGQYFTSDAHASKVFSALNQADLEDADIVPPGQEPYIDELSLNLLDFLGTEGLVKKIRQQGSLVSLDLKWKKDIDKEVGEGIVQATIGYVISKSMGSGMEPSEGPVNTVYASKPILQEKVDWNKIKGRVSSQLEQCFFPGWYFGQGESPHMTLEVDPIDIPNAALITVDYKIKAISDTGGRNVHRDDGKGFKAPISFRGPQSSHMQLPIQKGVKGDTLQTASLELKLHIPIEVSILKFQAGEAARTKKKSKKFSAKLKTLKKDVASVSYRGTRQSVEIYAFDKSGRALALNQGMSGGGSASKKFNGIIHELWVAAPMKIETLELSLDVDLNRGQTFQLGGNVQSNPRIRYDLSPEKSFRSVSEDELANLKVGWVENEERGWENGLKLTLPQGVNESSAYWELGWFAGDKPILLKGSSSYSGNRRNWTSRDIGKASAVTGQVIIETPTDIRNLTFKKQKDGAWLTQQLGKRPIKVRFNRNEVTYHIATLKSLEFRAYNSRGKRLRAGNWSGGSSEGNKRYFWGVPERFDLVLAQRTIRKTVPVEITKRDTDHEAFAKYKVQLKSQRKVALAIKKAGQAIRMNFNGYADDLAGQYYIHDKNGKPVQKVPEALAHACPEGAERFGYQTKPFGGYHFSFFPDYMQGGKKQTEPKRKKSREYTWAKGKIQTLPFNRPPSIIAVPVDASQPTFLLQWNNLMSKMLNGEKIEAKPENPWNEGWTQVNVQE